MVSLPVDFESTASTDFTTRATMLYYNNTETEKCKEFLREKLKSACSALLIGFADAEFTTAILLTVQVVLLD